MPDRGFRTKSLGTCSNHSSRRNRMEWAWGFRSRAPLSRRMAELFGRKTTPRMGRHFDSHCRLLVAGIRNHGSVNSTLLAVSDLTPRRDKHTFTVVSTDSRTTLGSYVGLMYAQ